MNHAEIFGGALYSSTDVSDAAVQLAEFLKSGTTDPVRALRFGLDVEIVDALRSLRLSDPVEIDRYCELGAAWVLGRRSADSPSAWQSVVSIPAQLKLPRSIIRTTAETLIGLTNEATTKVRFAAPFIDESGLKVLTESVISATLRAVDVEVVRPLRGDREHAALEELRMAVIDKGTGSQLKFLSTSEDVPFPHLKVMTVDSRAAYVGSANLTAAALEGRNLEFGVMVRGETVSAIDEFLDTFTRRDS